MKQFTKIMSVLQELSKKEFERYLIIFLAIVLVTALGIVYYISSTSTGYIEQITSLQRLSDKTALVLAENDQLLQEQQRIQALFEQEKDFNIKSYFELFCKQQNITAEAGWDTTSSDIGDKFTETILQATFKGQSMQKIVQVIDALDKKETTYIKEVTIRSEPNQKITTELRIGTVRPKKGISS
jgi:hypothetical protein